MKRILATLLLIVATALSQQERGYSLEEIFMGLPRPFANRPTAPLPGNTPAATAQALYENEVFFHLRNSFEKPVTDYLAPCFSKSLLAHFDRSRAEIEQWFEQYKDDDVKLPLSEGSIFTGTYEGATKFKIGETKHEKHRAQVTIHLTYTEPGSIYEWTDIAVFILSGDKWLLDDILFDPTPNQDHTLRNRTTIGRE